jgi:pimeloyl-ACP methyl ester carboxylesterase
MPDIRPFVSRNLSVNGISLHLHDSQGSGPPVLFLHGFLDTGFSYARVVGELGNEVRALCLDWRGHGGSRAVPEGMSFHQLDHLKDLAKVVAALQPVMIVAHSMGATVAYLYAAASPGSVARYLMLDAAGGFSSTPIDQADALSKLLLADSKPKPPFRDFPHREAAILRIRENNPGLSYEGAAVMVAGATEELADGSVRFRFDPRLRGPNPMRYSEAVWRELGARISDPVEVLLGEFGLIQKVPVLLERVLAMPTAQHQILGGVGHHLHLDAPVAVAAAVRRALASAAGRTPR